MYIVKEDASKNDKHLQNCYESATYYSKVDVSII